MDHPTSDKEKQPAIGADSGDTATVSSLESLSNALQVGFGLLKVIMLLLAVVFVFSNIFWVPEGYVAVQSRFGRIVGQGSDSVRPPGGPYPAYPYPIDTIVRIPTTMQKITVFNAFWSEKDEMVPMGDDRKSTQSLTPGVHGSLVTADKNLVQGVWVIHYKLAYGGGDTGESAAILDFVHNVGTMKRAAAMVQRLAEGAIVRVVSQTNVADFVAGRIDNRKIKHLMADRLKSLKTGIQITDVSARQYAVPRILVADFQAVTRAESQKALDIEKATRQRVSTLNELAGRGWQKLLDIITAHERALVAGDRGAEQRAFDDAERILLAGQLGGEIKKRLDEARGERSAAIQKTRAAASRFVELLPSHEKNAAVLESQLIQDAVRRIWSDISVDTLYVPRGQRVYLDLGRLGAMRWQSYQPDPSRVQQSPQSVMEKRYNRRAER